MPWWALAYVIVLAGVGVIGVLDDLKEGEAAWHIALGVSSVLFCLIFVIAWWRVNLAYCLGKLVLPMLMASVGYNIMTATEDLRALKLDPDYASRGTRWIPMTAIIGVMLLDLPAYYCAVGLSVRAWFSVPY